MPTDSLRNTRKKKTCFAQVSEVEKQLWARIHSHGVLDTDVKALYRKACFIYEKLFLSENDLQELQNIEYLLWRLHYKHIDEFRKTISPSNDTVENSVASHNNVDEHMEGFRVFLSEASKFYQDLIRGIKRYNGLFDEPWFYKNDEVSGRMEQTKLHKCQFVCHRLCICLGDLARYLELYEKRSSHQRNWAVAASYYLEAAKIYPDGGNPQNQLAVLATYIGEEFLALYHCVRSLAVKERFPDALQNLMLLFERNRSSDILSLTNEVHDLCKPSEWISNTCENRKSGVKDSGTPKGGTDFWALFIRMTSFFFLESSLESFACTFTSALRQFEELLALDVGDLSSALQSYQNMNLLKAGPYRALHIVSVLLFIIYNLTVDLEHKIWKPKKDVQHSELINLVLTVTFTFMGRLVDKCLTGRPVIYFPLLPALLVFVEWLVSALRELHSVNDKCEKAMRYFFGSFIKLLKHLQENTAEFDSSCNIALWEDYELRGFMPLSPTHELLDFSSRWEDEINYKMKNEYRARRIVQAAIKIATRNNNNSPNSPNWLVYNNLSKRFVIYGQETDSVEDEEDIVFKPIARHNSEPMTLKDGSILEASDECLRRASSLLVAQNRALIDSLSPSKQPAQNEKGSKSDTVSETTIAAGPPSLSSWVLCGDMTKSSPTERTVLTSIPEVGLEDGSTLLLASSAGWATKSSPDFVLQSGMPHELPNHVGPSYSSINHDSVRGSGSSGFGLLDHWSHNDPLVSLPTMYCEDSPPLFQPSPTLLHGLHEQRGDTQIPDYRKPNQRGLPVGSNPPLEPRPLLEYLKRREWQLRQESKFTGSYMQN